MNFTFKGCDISVHESWGPFFSEQHNELKNIENSIGCNFTPDAGNVFKVFNLPLDEIKFVIVGQDPYPQQGAATGRSFEIENDSWEYVNKSLEAILVSLHYYMTNQQMSYCDIIQKIDSGTWNLFPPGRIFKELEKQSGCFFLNKSLTCNVGKINSHKDHWPKFTRDLVLHISRTNRINPKWLLWGNDAKELKSLIISQNSIIEAIHPAKFSYVFGEESKNLLRQFAETSGLGAILSETNPKLTETN